MPNRWIKESVWTSPNLNCLSAEAERHFYRLLPAADDFGCFEATPAVVKGRCYPLKDDLEINANNINVWYKELIDNNIIVTWEDNGRKYGAFLTFQLHNHPRSLHKRKTPVPPKNIEAQMSQLNITPTNKPASNNPDNVTLDPVLAELSTMYESNIGMLTPVSIDQLKELVDEYPAEYIKTAISISVTNNHRAMAYIVKILKNSKESGTPPGAPNPNKKPAEARIAPVQECIISRDGGLWKGDVEVDFNGNPIKKK